MKEIAEAFVSVRPPHHSPAWVRKKQLAQSMQVIVFATSPEKGEDKSPPW